MIIYSSGKFKKIENDSLMKNRLRKAINTNVKTAITLL